MPINYIEVLEKLVSHKRWLSDDPTGQRADFTAENLDGMNLSNQILSGVIFTAATLEGANLSNCLATEANFTGAALAGANLSNTTLVKCNFTGADLTNADLRNAVLDDSNFLATVITGVDFKGASLGSVSNIIPVYSFSIGDNTIIQAVAQPGSLQLDDEIRPWSEWTDTLLSSYFDEVGLSQKSHAQHLLKVHFFKQLLIERGYNL